MRWCEIELSTFYASFLARAVPFLADPRASPAEAASAQHLTPSWPPARSVFPGLERHLLDGTLTPATLLRRSIPSCSPWHRLTKHDARLAKPVCGRALRGAGVRRVRDRGRRAERDF